MASIAQLAKPDEADGAEDREAIIAESLELFRELRKTGPIRPGTTAAAQIGKGERNRRLLELQRETFPWAQAATRKGIG